MPRRAPIGSLIHKKRLGGEGERGRMMRRATTQRRKCQVDRKDPGRLSFSDERTEQRRRRPLSSQERLFFRMLSSSSDAGLPAVAVPKRSDSLRRRPSSIRRKLTAALPTKLKESLAIEDPPGYHFSSRFAEEVTLSP